MEIVYLSPTQIKVKEGLDRYRQDMGDVKSLSESFLRVKQILPIVINRNNELIDGGRRLAACVLAGIQVKCVYDDAVDPAEMRELELEANLHRKDYTPAEEALAVRDLHKLKMTKYGALQWQSKDNPKPLEAPPDETGWSLQRTANLAGKSKTQIIRSLEIAAMVEQFPELAQAKKASHIRKAVKGLERIAEGVLAAVKFENSEKDPYTLLQADAVEHMRSIPDNSIDILCTDPIYGIDADKIATTIGGETNGNLTSSGYRIRDRKQDAFRYYRILANESIRFTHDKSQGYVFVGPEHQFLISRIFSKAGWRVHVKPLIWIKRETGQCNLPSIWPASCYEMLLFIRRDNARLVKEGMPDWIECPPVPASQRLHPYEKPVQLLTSLLERVSIPGMSCYDPFMGSGSTIEAATRLKMFSTGVDLATEAYLAAVNRMTKYKEQLANEQSSKPPDTKGTFRVQ